MESHTTKSSDFENTDLNEIHKNLQFNLPAEDVSFKPTDIKHPGLNEIPSYQDFTSQILKLQPRPDPSQVQFQAFIREQAPDDIDDKEAIKQEIFQLNYRHSEEDYRFKPQQKNTTLRKINEKFDFTTRVLNNPGHILDDFEQEEPQQEKQEEKLDPQPGQKQIENQETVNKEEEKQNVESQPESLKPQINKDKEPVKDTPENDSKSANVVKNENKQQDSENRQQQLNKQILQDIPNEQTKITEDKKTQDNIPQKETKEDNANNESPKENLESNTQRPKTKITQDTSSTKSQKIKIIQQEDRIPQKDLISDNVIKDQKKQKDQETETQLTENETLSNNKSQIIDDKKKEDNIPLKDVTQEKVQENESQQEDESSQTQGINTQAPQDISNQIANTQNQEVSITTKERSIHSFIEEFRVQMMVTSACILILSILFLLWRRRRRALKEALLRYPQALKSSQIITTQSFQVQPNQLNDQISDKIP